MSQINSQAGEVSSALRRVSFLFFSGPQQTRGTLRTLQRASCHTNQMQMSVTPKNTIAGKSRMLDQRVGILWPIKLTQSTTWSLDSMYMILIATEGSGGHWAELLQIPSGWMPGIGACPTCPPGAEEATPSTVIQAPKVSMLGFTNPV